MTVIATNISAITAANASNSASAMQSQAMTRLSTGQRINSAADDAAGLAISTSMTSQINGMTQGVKNANDGISMAQTAQGSLTEVTNMLQRVRQLGVQAENGTYQASDKSNMQSEVAALATQITSILGSGGTGKINTYNSAGTTLTQTATTVQNGTQFNGNKLFAVGATPAADTTVTIQAGANSTDAVKLTSKAIDWDTQSANLDVVANASGTVTAADTLLSQVSSTEASFGAGQNQLQSAVNNMNTNITNLSSARSRITDTDYSAESTNMSKAQILSQASTAMIAQANQSAQGVLSLLK